MEGCRKGNQPSEIVPEACDVSLSEEIEEPLTAPVQFSFDGKTHCDKALLDSGATLSNDGLIDTQLAQQLSKKLGLPLKPLERPRGFRGFDGKESKDAQYLFFPRMKVFDHEQPSVTLICTPLGTHKVLLGKRWLRSHGIVLDLPKGEVLYRKGHCKHTGAPLTDRAWPLYAGEEPDPTGPTRSDQTENQDKEIEATTFQRPVRVTKILRRPERHTQHSDEMQMSRTMEQELKRERPR